MECAGRMGEIGDPDIGFKLAVSIIPSNDDVVNVIVRASHITSLSFG